MIPSFKTTRRVEFRDTDAAGIMHFSVFFTAMEAAEQDLLRSLGWSVMQRDDEGPLGWPRVAAKCEYHSPVKFEDVYEIEVRPTRVGKKSVTFTFEFTHEGRSVATGEMTSVCCRFPADAAPYSIPIPEWIARRLRGEIGA
jgi:acyl-CoA thioester hydrolase